MTGVVVGLGFVPEAVVVPILGPGWPFRPEPTADDLAQAVAAIVRADVDVDKDMLNQMPQLRVLARTGVGTERVDVEEAARRGIPVVITPGSNTHAVAEGAIAHLLALSKSLPELSALVREGRWKEREQVSVGDLEGQTLAVLGYGRIGKRVAQLAQAFGMRVVAYDPYAEHDGVARAETISEAVCQATYVSIHLPATPETWHVVNRDLVSSMNPGTILVNLARGEVVDLDAAHWGLTQGILAGVGLDVFAHEPPEHHPIFDHPRVVLTPHVMGLSAQSAQATFEMAAQGVVDHLSGRHPAAIAHPQPIGRNS